MKFSIVTPSLNQGKFLEQNIKSVLDQDVSHVEHVICDGGSTDNTLEILKRYDDRIAKWVSEKDNGESEALNKALSFATGDIVGWLNADDYYQPHIFGRVERAFRDNPDAVLVYGDYFLVLEDGQRIRRRRPCRFDYSVLLYHAPLVSNVAAFFKRDRMVAAGGWDPSFHMCGDHELYVRYMRGNPKWARLPNVLGNNRLHRASKTSHGNLHERWRAELQRMRRRECPSLSDAELKALGAKAFRKMAMLMIQDGSIFEKAWFQVFRSRHYAEYLGRERGTIAVPFIAPVLRKILDRIDPIEG